MADKYLNNAPSKTNANAKAFLVKDNASQGSGEEGWISKAQVNQIIRDEVKAQLSAITSGTPDVPVLDGSTMKYMTLANFAKIVGEPLAKSNLLMIGDLDEISSTTDLNDLTNGFYYCGNPQTYFTNAPSDIYSSGIAGVLCFGKTASGNTVRCVQLLFNIASTSGECRIFMRGFTTSSGWKSWQSVAGEQLENLNASQSNPINLNTLIKPGSYYNSNTGVSYITNLPTNNGRGFRLDVIPLQGSSGYVKQRFQEYNSISVYERITVNGGSSWTVSWTLVQGS